MPQLLAVSNELRTESDVVLSLPKQLTWGKGRKGLEELCKQVLQFIQECLKDPWRSLKCLMHLNAFLCAKDTRLDQRQDWKQLLQWHLGAGEFPKIKIIRKRNISSPHTGQKWWKTAILPVSAISGFTGKKLHTAYCNYMQVQVYSA